MFTLKLNILLLMKIIDKSFWLEGCPSGQREQTVNLPRLRFEGSNPSPSTISSGSSSVGRALAFQAKGREFEPRLPLQFFMLVFARVVELVDTRDLKSLGD